MSSISLPYPSLIFLGDLTTKVNAKTGQGLVDWCPERCLGQLRLPNCTVDLGIPDLDIPTAAQLGAKSLVIGIAPVGGDIKQDWVPLFIRALEAGLSIINGLHVELIKIPALAAAVQKSASEIIQVRTPPTNIPVGTGRKRSGKRVLMVGTDCGVGKKYSALSLHRALIEAGIKATFRATGQTGIMIAGSGIPMDAVKADFITGAAEMLSPDNEDDHWDVIEGQGALHHPGYSAVSLGILHGSQPDAFVLCHEATRIHIDGFPGYYVDSLHRRIEEAKMHGRITNPDIQCVGLSINTGWLPKDQRSTYLQDLEEAMGLPCIDPLTGDLTPIIHNLMAL